MDSDKLLLTDNFMKQTKDNLSENGKVCLATWDEEGVGFKFVGDAAYFTKGEWKNRVENLDVNKGFSAKGAILVTVSKVIPLK